MSEEKIGLIYQPCGLGDILFIQKIAHHIKNLGFQVYWPVVHELSWLNNYISDFNFISWDTKENPLPSPPLSDDVIFPFKDFYSPNNSTTVTDSLFFFQGFINAEKIMAGKYNSINLDWSDWRDYIIFNRDIEKENELFYNVLNLNDNDEYIFVNRKYGTRPNVMQFSGLDHIFHNQNTKIVEMDIIDGFSLFDWIKVLENAKEIHIIETSLNYLLESPQLFEKIKDKPLHLYHRYGFFHEVDYLFKLPWNYIL